MLNLERYLFQTNPNFFDYEFESIGPKGTIRKVARFSFVQKGLYSFGFGDLDKRTGEISDIVESNNGDSEKILAIVAQIIYYFTGIYQDVYIFIQGSNAARTRWYQMGIAKHWEEIEPIFEVTGYREGKWEPFRKGRNYEAFIGRRKTSFLFLL